MKKYSLFLALLIAAMLMTGCKNSDGSGAEAATQKATTQAYSIPEGAEEPGDVPSISVADDFPEDKKPSDHSNEIQVRYFYINSKGLNEEFDVFKNKECDAANLNQLLIESGVIVDGTEVLSFESDGKNGVLELNRLEGMSTYATEELLAQAIANTYTDNLFLDTLTIKVGDQVFGPLQYDSGKKKE